MPNSTTLPNHLYKPMQDLFISLEAFINERKIQETKKKQLLKFAHEGTDYRETKVVQIQMNRLMNFLENTSQYNEKYRDSILI